ncbi:iron uptake transporter deferrochelatase/peroxidase subunit [Kitasatospora purpeofusca]|uniref:iron uptake transporter deferrochelatase/peroxidase subunit n=1 Tax=Kitasatospora purpeofusca TaxID=67352 RepID=UPI0022515441|nr:iron uptake transporter deferrochelatase/peroxidase subunit [Kitasatospora purpeofusca]MCX4759254.1 iron uptake transporter deferrochelatase/peroxidase subunit [Kitasatospora purpeofusca]WSR30347.1 iron uptake transporter deferrochelatase/peroxidase subunit [Kitasatospora purpeofusca]WSR38582.1 iron uptake transporter deferrochelatase/peroxidase subunit [Kitasatospora purpeofusca]
MDAENQQQNATPAATADATAESSAGRAPVSRRAVIGWAGAGVALGAAGVGSVAAATRQDDDTPAAPAATADIPFFGDHQSGIATPVQDRLHFAAFDVSSTATRDSLVRMLKEWTKAAAAMTGGREVGSGAASGLPEAPPDDTGEALGLPASRLTLTIGFGPSLFEKSAPDGQTVDRFGLKARRPEALIDLPRFKGDNLDPQRSGGDLCIQACADDPQVAVHAIRNLARIGMGTVNIRWSQLGFGKTSSTTPDAQTPRNMMGFKDGTHNIAGTDTAKLAEHVWAAPGEGPDWMTGGSYLVARRIRMHIETWDRTSLKEQEDVFGRTKGEGAAYGRTKEHDAPDLKAMPADAHVRLAHPESNDGLMILRRGFSFTDGTDGLGRLDAGLFFLAYQRDTRKAFVPLQQRLAASDALNEYIQHVGSAHFACPAGVRKPGEWWGQALFG